MCLGQGQNAKSQYTFWFLSHCDTITVHMSDSNSSTDPASALATLLTEARYKPSERIDELSTTEMLQVMNAADREVADAVAREIPAIARAVDAIAAALAPERGGRLFYVGAGTSGRLGVLDASECPPTFNVPSTLVQGLIAGGEYALRHSVEGAEDSPELGATDLRAHGFGAKDVLAGIAASGRTPYVLGAMEYARSLGAITIGVSCVPGSEVARAAEIAITPAVGPEVVTGSTRLRAGTATKLVLNMLSTGAMIRLGYGLQQPDGECAALQREARRPRRAHRCRTHRIAAGAGSEPCSARRDPSKPPS